MVLSAGVMACLRAGGYSVPVGQDVMISVYNIHRSAAVWDDPHAFRPERFPLDEPVPSEQNTNYRRDVPLSLGYAGFFRVPWLRRPAHIQPGRFPKDQPVPGEQNADHRRDAPADARL